MPTTPRAAISLLGAGTGGASFDDSGATTRVLAVVAILVVLGLAVLAFTWWFWRSTRPEPEALAPLELLGSRRLRRIDPDQRRRLLDSVRPSAGDAVAGPAPVEPVDLAALAARDLPPLEELFGEAAPEERPAEPAGETTDDAPSEAPSSSAGT